MNAHVLAFAALVGCNNSSQTGGPTAPTASTASTASGVSPLASLTVQSAVEEPYTVDGQGPQPFLFFATQRFSLSSKCRKPDGTLDCDAIRFLRTGDDVAIPRAKLTGAASAGAMICTKLGNQNMTAKKPNGDEDGVCRFPDGSMVSIGALEQYRFKAE